jgi:hypothetical protein
VLTGGGDKVTTVPYVLENLTGDAEAKRVVDALMDSGAHIIVMKGHDAETAAKEVAIRIIGIRELRFAA